MLGLVVRTCCQDQWLGLFSLRQSDWLYCSQLPKWLSTDSRETDWEKKLLIIAEVLKHPKLKSF